MRNIIFRVHFYDSDTTYDGIYVDFSDFKKIRDFFKKHPDPTGISYHSNKNTFVINAGYSKSHDIPDYENPVAVKEMNEMYKDIKNELV